MKRIIVPGVVIVGLLISLDALARVGGGQGYSGGGGSGGGYGGGGSGGGGGDGLGILIWLLIEQPIIGVPVLIIVVGFYVYNNYAQTAGGNRYASHQPQLQPVAAQIPGRDALQALDPNFSMPLFVDFAQLVYARGQQMRTSKDTAVLRAQFSERALKSLHANPPDLESVEDVIFGATRVVRFQAGEPWVTAAVRFETNITEVRGGKRTQLLCDELWRFRRRADVLSPGPSGMRSLDCPNCGSPLEPGLDGRCPSCGSVRVGGQIQWEVVAIEQAQRRPLHAPELHLGGGIEPGYNRPTIIDPELPALTREFLARHPEHDWGRFQNRAREIFFNLQDAWSGQDWTKARPYQTDALFEVHRFWIARYKRFGLNNKMDQIEVIRTELVKVEVDAFLESATLRIYARMLDWTEDEHGRIVAGSKRDVRLFSEYWTFIRMVGNTPPHPDAWSEDRCPSCGAPLDQVSMAGICGYCDAKITGGDYDWVLSRIEQDEAYSG
ncbi:MAG: TIM44-like domain-containing protein [Myxococcota bacterium]